MRELARFSSGLILTLLVLLLVGCGGPPEMQVVISPNAVQLQGGQRVVLNASVLNASNTQVIWDKTGGILDVDASGLKATFTMPNIAQDSSFTVTVTSVADPSKKASATLSLGAATSQARIEITSDPSVLLTKQGDKAQVRAMVFKADGSPDPSAKIEWLSSAADQISVSADGEVTALTALGSAQIMANYGELDPQVVSAFVASVKPATKLLEGGSLKSTDATGNRVILAKTAQTSAIGVGDVLYSGGKNRVLARVTAVVVGTDNITVTVVPASLPEAFSALKVVNSDLPDEFRAKLQRSVTRQSARQTARAGACKFEQPVLGAEFKLGTVSSVFNFSPFFDYEIDSGGLKYFKLGAAGTVRVQGTLGELKLTAALAAKMTCKVNGGLILLPAFAAGPVLVDGLLTGELGLEATVDLKLGATCTLLTLDYGAKAYAGVIWDRNAGESPLKSFTSLGNGAKGPTCNIEPAQLGLKIEPFIGTELAVGMDFPFPIPGFHVGLLEGKVIGGLEIKHDAFYAKTDTDFRGFDWSLYAGFSLTPEPLLRDLEAVNKSMTKYFGFANAKFLDIKFKLIEMKFPFAKTPTFFLNAPSKAKPESDVELKVSSDVPPDSPFLPLYALNKVEFWAIKGIGAPFKIGESKIDSLGNGKFTWKTPKNVPDKDNTYKIRALIYDNIFSALDSPTTASKAKDLSLDPDFDLKLEPTSIYREAKKDETVFGVFSITNYGIDFAYTAQATTGVATLTGVPSGTLTLLQSRLISFRAKCSAVGSFSDVIEVKLQDPKNPDHTSARSVPFSLTCKEDKKPKPKDPPPPPKPPKPNDPPPKPDDPPPPPPIRAHSNGDPHLMTYDGHYYDFQATGDFILSKSLIPDDDFEVQVRYRKPLSVGPTYSLGYGVAANVQGTKLEVYATPAGKPKILINGAEIAFTDNLDRALSGGGALTVRGSQVVMAWADQSTVTISMGGDHIGSVDLWVNGWRKGQLEGLLGDGNDDPNNDLKIRGGEVLTNPSLKDLYLKFRQSWRVPMNSSEALFTQGPDLFDPFFPPNIITLADLDPAAVAKAQTICLARGIVTEDIFLACVFDVALTGDPAWADIAFGVDPNVPGVYLRPLASYVPIGRVNRVRRFGAYITGVENEDVTWKVSGGKFIQVSNNVIDFVAPQTQGTYEITATLSSDPTLSSTARVIVAPASNLYWDGGGDKQNWSDAKNWVDDKLPNADSDVVIQNTSPTPINLNANIGSVYSLRTEGKVNLSGTVKTLTGGSLGDGSSFAGLNLETNGIVTLTGQTTWSLGTLGGTGKFVNQGELDLTPGNYKYLSTILENTGTIKVQDNFYPGSASGLLKNAGTLEFVNDADIGTSGGFVLGVVNTGIILKSGGGDVTQLEAILTNTGTLETKTGTLRLRYGTLSGGTYNVVTSATLELNNDLTIQGVLTGNALGTVLANNVTLHIPDAQTATLKFAGTGFTWAVGNIVGPGKLINDSSSLLNLVGGNYKYLSTTLENAGRIKVQDNFYPGSASGLLKNAGTLEFVGDVGIGESGSFRLTLENTGTILKSGGGNVTQLDANLTNTGTLETKTGTLRLRYGTLNGGIYNVTAGATLDLNNDLTLQGTLTGNAAGTILVSNTTLRIPDGLITHLNFTGTGFTWSVGNIVGPGKLVNDAGNTLNLIGGNYKYLSTTLENLGTIKISDNFYPGSASGVLKNAGTLEFVNDADVGTSGGFLLNLENTGIILKLSGTDVTQLEAILTNTGTLETKTGTLRLRYGTLNGGIYNVTAGATLDLNNDLTVQGTLTGNAAGTILVSNTTLRIPNGLVAHLNFTATGTTLSVVNIFGPGKLVNDGLMNFVGGNYKYLSTTLENTGTIKISDNFYPGSAAGLIKNAGMLEFVNDTGVGTSGGFVLGIVNTGTLLKSGGVGTSTIDADVTNTGTITEQSGHFSFPRGVH